jgi:hypothetical protein
MFATRFFCAHYFSPWYFWGGESLVIGPPGEAICSLNAVMNQWSFNLVVRCH